MFVNGRGPSGGAGGPSDYETLSAYSVSTQNGVKITLPAWSVVNMAVEKK